jgi:IS30 family transposase
LPHAFEENVKKRVQRNRKALNRGGIRNRVSIHKRSLTVEDRQEFGHREGDLIIGKEQQSSMGTLVERSCRFTLIVPLKARNSQTVVDAFIEVLKKSPPHLRKSMTYDQGTEMAEHERLTEKVGIQVYFADPGQPQQRGTNKNTNGLIREYFPKKTNLRKYSDKEISRVENILNQRPKAVLSYATPKEIFTLAEKYP